jgi:transcriptional regulator with XRE-family HTH domain
MEPRQMLIAARRGAGLSQRGLARRAGVPQPTIARIESGAVTPNLSTLEQLLASCGYRLALEAAAPAPADGSAIRELLSLSPAQRLRRAAAEGQNLDRFLRGSWA